jgi:hypothetical protein
MRSFLFFNSDLRKDIFRDAQQHSSCTSSISVCGNADIGKQSPISNFFFDSNVEEIDDLGETGGKGYMQSYKPARDNAVTYPLCCILSTQSHCLPFDTTSKF